MSCGSEPTASYVLMGANSDRRLAISSSSVETWGIPYREQTISTFPLRQNPVGQHNRPLSSRRQSKLQQRNRRLRPRAEVKGNHVCNVLKIIPQCRLSVHLASRSKQLPVHSLVEGIAQELGMPVNEDEVRSLRVK